MQYLQQRRPYSRRHNYAAAIRNGFVVERTHPTSLLSLSDDLLIYILHAILLDRDITTHTTLNTTPVFNFATTCVRLWRLLHVFLHARQLTWHDLTPVAFVMQCTKCKSRVNHTFSLAVSNLAHASFKHINMEAVCHHHNARLLRLIIAHCKSVHHLSLTDMTPRARPSSRPAPFHLPDVIRLSVRYPAKWLYTAAATLPRSLRELKLNTIGMTDIPNLIALLAHPHPQLRHVEIRHLLPANNAAFPTPRKLHTARVAPPHGGEGLVSRLVAQHARYILTNFEPRHLLITTLPSRMRAEQAQHACMFGVDSPILCASSFTTPIVPTRVDKTPDAPAHGCRHVMHDGALCIMLPQAPPAAAVSGGGGNILRWCSVVKMPFERVFDPWNVFAAHHDFSQLRQITISNTTFVFFNSVQHHIGYGALYERFVKVLKSAAQSLTIVEMTYVGLLPSPPRMMIGILRHVPCIAVLVVCGDFITSLHDKMSDMFKLAVNLRALHFVDLVGRQSSREKIGRVCRRFDFLYSLPSILLCLQLYCSKLGEIVVRDQDDEDTATKFDHVPDSCLTNGTSALNSMSRSNPNVNVESLRSWMYKWMAVLRPQS